jgi:hypothetical protein
MNNVLILLDDLSVWKPFYETNSIFSVSDYLQNKSIDSTSKLVINLSGDFSYNSEGYYCSLLAQARGDKVVPSVETLNKLESETGIRLDSYLHKLCWQWILKNNITADLWSIDVFFWNVQRKRT